jgi:hypothetical protein
MKRLLLVTLASSFAATLADAAPPVREWRNTFGVMVNVVGLEDILDVTWTWKLSESNNPLLSDAHVTLGATNTFSPAYDRVGGWIEVSPLSILDVRAGVEPTVYFGLFNSLQDFGGYDSPFDEDTRDEHNDSYAGLALRTWVAPTLKVKVGRVAAVWGVEVEWWRAGGDGPFFYEPARDTLLESDGDRVFRTSGALLFELRRGAGRQTLLGPTHQLTRVEGARRNRVQRAGLLLVHDLGPRRLGLSRPQLIAQVARYIDDPFKEDELWALAAIRFSFGAR